MDNLERWFTAPIEEFSVQEFEHWAIASRTSRASPPPPNPPPSCEGVHPDYAETEVSPGPVKQSPVKESPKEEDGSEKDDSERLRGIKNAF